MKDMISAPLHECALFLLLFFFFSFPFFFFFFFASSSTRVLVLLSYLYHHTRTFSQRTSDHPTSQITLTFHPPFQTPQKRNAERQPPQDASPHPTLDTPPLHARPLPRKSKRSRPLPRPPPSPSRLLHPLPRHRFQHQHLLWQRRDQRRQLRHDGRRRGRGGRGFGERRERRRGRRGAK